MILLHIETGMNLYGGARQVGFILEGLQKRGVENLLICPAGSEIAKLAASISVQVLPFNQQKGLGLQLYRDIKKALKKHSPDLVHVHSRRLGADLWGGLAARKLQVPALLSRRVDNPEPRWIVRWKYGLYDQVIAISEGIRQVLIKEGLGSEHVTTVRSAIELNTAKTHCDRAGFERTFGVKPQQLTIAVIAQLIHRKGHRHLLAVLPEILTTSPNLRVIFFGKGAEETALRKSTEELGLKAVVEFAGFRDDLLNWLPCIDLVVHPADMEGLGVSLIQAAAAHRPIVAVRSGGMPEIVHHHVNGLLVSPGNTSELKEAVLTLLGDDKKRTAFGAAGRALVERSFTVDAMVDGNLQCYQEIISTNKNPLLES
ncbi:MAG: glycosyltransferase [Thiotrichales bacterium]